MRSLLARVTYVLLVLMVSSTAYLLVRDHREEEAFHQAKAALFNGEYERAAEGFSALEAGWFWRDQSSTGRRLSRALLGDDRDLSELSASDAGAFAVELLLNNVFLERDYVACLRLTSITPDHSSSRLFQIASMLEMGETEQARLLWDRSPFNANQHWLVARLRETFDLSFEAIGLIRDRKGRLLAWRDGREQLQSRFPAGSQWLELIRQVPLRPLAGSVRTSLDIDLVEVSERALEGYRGTILLLEPMTGEILAAVSDGLTAESGIPAFEQRREPASIVKLITTSAALRSDLDPDRFLNQAECQGAKRYSGGILYCAYPVGPLRGLDRSMAISCNIGFADLAIEAGRDPVLEEFRRFGFDRGSFFGRINEKPANQRQLADLAIGLEATDITPLHAALLAATVANQGQMIDTRLVAGEDGRIGASPRFALSARARRVLSADHSEVLKRAMLAVVTRGTGSAIANPGFPVAMKTGTGRDPGKGGYHINYIGFGPVNRPTIAFAVRVTHQRNSPRVRRAGVEVTRRLLDGLDELQQTGKWPYLPARREPLRDVSLAQSRASR